MGARAVGQEGSGAVDGLRELGTIYEGVRRRIVGLVDDLDDPASVPVPACPGWSVHDLISHLAGSCSDVMTGNLDGLASPAWTAAQVDVRRDRSVEDVIAEWQELGPQIASMVDDFPEPYGVQAIADLAVHEQDVRDALARPGMRDSDAVAIGLDFLATVIVHSAVAERGLGPLEARAGERTWMLGTDGAEDSDEAPVATVRAEPFELFRAFSGRRSPAQIARFEWSVDPEPFLPVFAVAPYFSLRTTDLNE